MNEARTIAIVGKTGCRLSLYTGMIEKGFDDRWSSERFYHAYKGDYVEFVSDKLKEKYEFMVAEYSLDTRDELIYTYCYEPEENWTTYCHNMTPDSYSSGKYEITKECYIRVNIRRKDGAVFDGVSVEKYWELMPEKVSPVRLVTRLEPTASAPKDYFRKEIEDTVDKVNHLDGKKYLILADSHYVINGTWENTIANIREVASKTSLDGIIHLGDFTDGLVSKEINKSYVKLVYDDLLCLGLPLFVTLGNHDSNYFHNNPDTFTEEEQNDIYLSSIPDSSDKLYYYHDDIQSKIRMIFLHSHDYREKNRYGYSNDELEWFKDILNTTPDEYKVMVLSHVPPMAKYHFWSDVMRNGDEMMNALIEFNESRKNTGVLAWVHGHNHGDAIWNERGVKVVSLGCNKCEYFEDKKPDGTITYPRKLGTVSEDLWDVMCIEKTGKLQFVRFGAGEDREILQNE